MEVGAVTGATSFPEPADTPYGNRAAPVVDPSGNTWSIAAHRRDSEPWPAAAALPRPGGDAFR